MQRKLVFGSLLVTTIIISLGSYMFINQRSIQRIKSTVFPAVRHKVQDDVHSTMNTDNVYRNAWKGSFEETFCRDINKTIVSETNPPFYPLDGIGRPANISEDEFDTTHLNKYCSADQHLAAIVIVYSAAQNFDRRTAIRATIGKQCSTANCKLLFIVGISLNNTIANRVKKEYMDKLDIFIKDKIDTYVDLNNKAVAMLDWLLKYCQQPKFVIHLIDDAFVNIRLYMQGLTSIPETERYFYGRIFFRRSPHRNPKSIYYVTHKEYPSPIWPDFIVGISYAFPNAITRELRCAVHKAKYVWLEDVWLLGLIKDYLGIKLIESKYESWHININQLDMKNVHKYLYIHGTNVEDFYRFQNALDTS